MFARNEEIRAEDKFHPACAFLNTTQKTKTIELNLETTDPNKVYFV